MTMAKASNSSSHELFDALQPQPLDPLLKLMVAFAGDGREHKIDLGVGMYRSESGITPVMRAVKAAETVLLERQMSKGYVGAAGDTRFLELLRSIVFDRALASSDRLIGIQSPGGTGALRLAADLIAAASPTAKVWLGTPTWANYLPIMGAARLTVESVPHFDVATQRLRFDEMMSALDTARAGDVVLLQGCCHNPTGTDFDRAQWTAIAQLLSTRGLVPLIDVAYQGLGQGLEQDISGARIVLDHVGEALISYSCSKVFGLYRERTGALFVLSQSAARGETAMSNLVSLARAAWSMPPDHGAAVVRTILESESLTGDWKSELESMRARVIDNRCRLAAIDARFAPLLGQQGMFSVLPLSPADIERLRSEHAVYMVGSGRINVAGFTGDQIERFVAALLAL